MLSFFKKGPKKVLRNPARRHSKARKMETNGPSDMKLGLKLFLNYLLRDQRCFPQLFFKNLGLNGLFFDERPKKALWNPARRHWKARKMETNCPTDLKLGLKLSLEYLFVIKMFPEIFSQIWVESPRFLTKGQKSRSGTQHTITQSLVKWKLIALGTWYWA